MVAPITHAEPVHDNYERVVAELERYRGTTISVPELSEFLGVKTTTINARFRREGISVKTVGRTNYVPGELAIPLVDMHKYALRGWPTLQEVSRVSGIKTGTLKARCEKGKLEGYVDLTKRLRINPDEAATLSLERHRSPKAVHAASKSGSPFSGKQAKRVASPKTSRQPFTETPTIRQPFTLPPAPEPRVQVITARDYGFASRSNETPGADKKNSPAHFQKKRGALTYDPEKPFSISECSVGKSIKYEQHDGTIIQLIKDPFNPAIKVALPNHDEPLMREILLRVAR